MEEPKPGWRYLHFKGGEYEVIAVGRDCHNSGKKVVVYKQLYNSEHSKGTIWVRSLEDFLGDKKFEEDVVINGRTYKTGENVKRFILIPNIGC